MEINNNHIIPYLQGDLTAEERKAFELQMSISPEFKSEVEEVRFIWFATRNLKLQREVQVSSRWKSLSNKITFILAREKAWRFARSLTAAAFIPFALGTWYIAERLFSEPEMIAEEIEVTTAYGLISKILLPDSSVVSLNSGSTLRYPQRFDGPTRSVSLVGEAYFQVKADAKNRFDVLLPGGLRVSAYGTEFNVNAYEEQTWIEAVLAEGHVEVSRINQHCRITKELAPGQLAYANKKESDIFVSDVNVYAKTAWKDGKMVFRRAKMPEIARRLSQHFNVDIKLLEQEISQYEYSATFTTETLSEILNLLKQSAPIQWHYIEPLKQEDDTFTKRKVIIQLVK